MSTFKLEKKVSKKTGRKYVFSQHDGIKKEGPCIEYYPAQNATKIGVLNDEEKFIFEFKINNKDGSDYTARMCNKDGYPQGLSMVSCNETLYFGKFSSREGFNGIVYRFKKNENVRIQKYNHGILVDECVHEYVLKENISVPLPFECNCEVDNVEELMKSTLNGPRLEYILGNPDSRINILAGSIDEEGNVSIGQYSKKAFNGLCIKSTPSREMVTIRTIRNNNPDGDFELVYKNGIIENVSVNGFAAVFKKEESAGYIDLTCSEKNGVISMMIFELTSNKKTIKSSIVEFPNEINSNDIKPTYVSPKPTVKVKKATTAQEELDSLIGLTSVKKELAKMKAMLHKFKSTPDGMNLNMCFYGNPGTGKTEVARIVANILYEEGILPSNKLIEIDSSGLISQFVGQTAIKTHEKVEEAMGGVLFIDEAYALNSSGTTSYGPEAIAALLKDMEDYRGKFCVILAGYKEPMEEMLAVNDGFKSRINRYIDFPDYSLDELRQIALLMYKKKGYTMNDSALDEIIKILSLVINRKDFANAREVRNLLESIYEIQALRTAEDVSNMEITLSDILEYERDHNISFKKVNTEKKIKWDLSKCDILELKPLNISAFDVDYIEQCSVNIIISKNGKVSGEGSGFFISPKGIIGTCAHVVKGADRILVIVNIKTASGQSICKDYAASVIATNEVTDVAIIGILNPDMEFPYYPLKQENSSYPKLMTEILMGGYPFGGSRFESITITEGKIQSINKDNRVGDNIVKFFVDISGQPGSSGSGVIDKKTGECVAVFSGAATEEISGLKLTMNYAIPISYLWLLLDSLDNNISINASDNGIEKFSCCIETTGYIASYSRKNQISYNNIHIVKGDVSTFEGDAVVNAANKYLAAGAGVCGAIFAKAGYKELQNECAKIGGCPVGKAVITNGYNLSSKYIIHAVGPHYLHDEYPEKLLESVYEYCFKIALEKGIKTIAFPSISTGIFRFPIEKAAPIALKVIKKYSKKFESIYVYCYGDDNRTYSVYSRELDK